MDTHRPDLTNERTYSRRQFVRQGLVMASAATTLPLFLQNSALAMQNQRAGRASIPGVPEDRVLVVVQLGGGNDGLNTVVPYGDGAYYNARPGIGIPERDVLKLRDGRGIGLHPSMTGIKELYDQGLVAIAQGVGYPNPNRSHFASMDIWHTADTSGVGDGWLGRYFDNQCNGAPDDHGGSMGVTLQRSAPLAMLGRSYKPITFEDADLFRWTGEDLHRSLVDPYRKLAERLPENEELLENPNAAFLLRTALDAQVSGAKIREAVATRPLVNYPRSGLAQQLAMVGAMIRAGLDTRVYYVDHGGFDTHAGQGGANGSHSNLLRQYGDAVKAFYEDLKAQGNEGRVLTVTFSEFGRRVAQNGTNGTDHGTAAPMFLMGPMVDPGVHGKHPSLTNLDNGDLKFKTDFRTVYANVLEDWLRADSQEVLGKRWRKASLLRAR